MPLIVTRDQVLDLYAEAARRKWVIPCFCSENLTTTEAVLAAASDFARQRKLDRVPITVGITNQYSHRAQSAWYTHSRRWDVGLRLFMAELQVLARDDSPYANVDVMVHLDHTQHDHDRELLEWDMGQFSSIMFDASTLPFEENIAATRQFVRAKGDQIVVEGACDEILDAGGEEAGDLTSPDHAERYVRETGADMIVANLGTEHRASAASLQYHGDLARQISSRIGPKLVLHGCSSVPPEQIGKLFDDGICKANVWTALERDSSPVLLAEMVRNAVQVAGAEAVGRLQEEGLLGPGVPASGRAALSHFTTCYRQDIVFQVMKEIVVNFLAMWYPGNGKP
ncbi:MAG: class II fructose-bisphosphate aldolase [Candidatus Anammoximicrobium sp.]|nr:class II fructose-bisphosphate aldolase [Candidatus Anammoximicrobium sp.]